MISKSKKNHEISHRIDTVGQTVEIINIEITTHDQILSEPTIRLLPVPIQILQLKSIRLIDPEIPHIIETETIQNIEIINIKITDHAIILTTDQKSKYNNYQNRKRNKSQHTQKFKLSQQTEKLLPINA